MHELAVSRSILSVALRYAEEEKATKIVSISISVGGLRDFVGEWMQRYFDYLSRGTIADQARLKIFESPIVLGCVCGERFVVTLEGLRQPVCPRCGQGDAELISGNEFCVNDIEVI
jgi:hydrogenase nickel incorporation protein HypA/HybF